jgi:hypothetical protein
VGKPFFFVITYPFVCWINNVHLLRPVYLVFFVILSSLVHTLTLLKNFISSA